MTHSNRWSKERPHSNHGESNENKRESRPIYVLNTKVMTTRDHGEVRVNGIIVKVVTGYVFLGALTREV